MLENKQHEIKGMNGRKYTIVVSFLGDVVTYERKPGKLNPLNLGIKNDIQKLLSDCFTKHNNSHSLKNKMENKLPIVIALVSILLL